MKWNILFSVISLIVLLNGCKESTQKIVLINNSSIQIESIWVSAANSTTPKYDLSVGDSIIIDLIINDNKDGDFNISYMQDNIQMEKKMGYYTNGSSICEKYIILFTNSDLIIKEISHKL